jgi:hypothetical protein
VDLANLIIGVVQAVTSTVGIGLAVVALRAIRRERRTVFELELLHQMLIEPQHALQGRFSSPAMHARLACLPPDELPVWRVAADAVKHRTSVRRALKNYLGWADDQTKTSEENLNVFAAYLELKLAEDIQVSIANRVGGRRPVAAPARPE